MRLISTLLIWLVVACMQQSVAGDLRQYDDFADAWVRIDIGVGLEEAKRALKGRYSSMGLERMDGAGYRKYWKTSKRIDGEITEEFVFRGVIPHGEIYVLHFDEHQKITDKEIIFVTEEEYQAQVRAHREAKRKEKSNQSLKSGTPKIGAP